jgi:hypothetical protein
VLVFFILFISGNVLAEKSLKLNWKYEFLSEEQKFLEKPSTYADKEYMIGVYKVHTHLFKHDIAKKSAGAFKVFKAKLVREKLIIELIVHNTSETSYQCVYLNDGELFAYMDDELGNEYKGAIVGFANELDNKLAVNQRKKVIIKIPRPDDDADIVNMHFGITFVAQPSHKTCEKPIVNWKMNFHKLNWDLSALRD